MLFFHILFILPFFFFEKRFKFCFLLFLGVILPDLLSIPFIFGGDSSRIVQNIFVLCGSCLAIGIIIGIFSRKLSITGIFFILYAGCLNHLLVDFISHPDFSPFYPFQFTLTDAFSHPFFYWGWAEYDWMTIIGAVLLVGSIGCIMLGKKYYYKKTLKDEIQSELSKLPA